MALLKSWVRNPPSPPHGIVAQLGERRRRKSEVVSSTLTGSTKHLAGRAGSPTGVHVPGFDQFDSGPCIQLRELASSLDRFALHDAVVKMGIIAATLDASGTANRCVAQPGGAPVSGTGGQRFKSALTDQDDLANNALAARRTCSPLVRERCGFDSRLGLRSP